MTERQETTIMAGTGTTISKTIFRKEKRAGWTTIDNSVLDDKELSFKALGLLCFLLSKPDNWRFNYRHITTTHTDGEAAVRSGMQELEQAGYLSRERERQQDGTLAWVITVREEPKRPCGGFPRMDNPGMDNHHLVITEGASTEENTLTLLSVQESIPDPTPAAPSKTEIEADFDEWYAAYPRKRKPGAARPAYIKARKKAGRQELLDGAEALARLVKAQGGDTTYTPYPSSWLNHEQWRDEETPQPNPFEAPPMRFG